MFEITFDTDIEKKIAEILDEFEEDVREYAEEILFEKAKELAEKIRQSSPFDENDPELQHYKEGWTVAKDKFGDEFIYVIYNALKPTLTHLLEHGSIRESTGEVEAIPHIYNNYYAIQEELLNELK